MWGGAKKPFNTAKNNRRSQGIRVIIFTRKLAEYSRFGLTMPESYTERKRFASYLLKCKCRGHQTISGWSGGNHDFSPRSPWLWVVEGEGWEKTFRCLVLRCSLRVHNFRPLERTRPLLPRLFPFVPHCMVFPVSPTTLLPTLQ